MPGSYSSQFKLRYLLGVSTGLAVAVAITLMAWAHLPVWASFAAGLGLTIPIFGYGNSVRKHAMRRQTTDEQLQVKFDEEGKWVSDKLINHYRHVLSPDEEVCLVTRFHFAKLVAHLARTPTRLLVTLALVLGLLPGSFLAVFQGYLPWWVIPLAAGPILLFFWYETIQWRYTIFILSDKLGHIVFRPPLLLAPVMRGFNPELALSSVQNWDNEDSRIANLFGMNYGRIIMDSPSDMDKLFNDLFFMKHPEWVKQLIGALVQEARKNLTAGSLLGAEV